MRIRYIPPPPPQNEEVKAGRSLKRGDTVTVIGRRWFDVKNTGWHHSVMVLVNGVPTGVQREGQKSTNGSIEETAYQLLRKAGRIRKDQNESLPRYCDERSITYYCTACDVRARKELTSNFHL